MKVGEREGRAWEANAQSFCLTGSPEYVFLQVAQVVCRSLAPIRKSARPSCTRLPPLKDPLCVTCTTDKARTFSELSTPSCSLRITFVSAVERLKTYIPPPTRPRRME
jgi:hypothetical protein